VIRRSMGDSFLQEEKKERKASSEMPAMRGLFWVITV
jgi:hypothetical protein